MENALPAAVAALPVQGDTTAVWHCIVHKLRTWASAADGTLVRPHLVLVRGGAFLCPRCSSPACPPPSSPLSLAPLALAPRVADPRLIRRHPTIRISRGLRVLPSQGRMTWCAGGVCG
jgi:hypothetical protein